MGRIKNGLLLPITIFSLLIISPSATGDPLGINSAMDKINSIVDRIIDEINTIESTTNRDMSDRIKQVSDIATYAQNSIDKDINHADAILQNSLIQLSSIEDKTNKDAINLIYVAQCAATKTLQDDLPRAIDQALSKLQQSEPSISVFGLNVIKTQVKNVKQMDPDAAYRQLRTAADLRLNMLGKDADAYEIVSIYQNLELVARTDRCIYITQEEAIYFDREVNDLERLSRPWRPYVKL